MKSISKPLPLQQIFENYRESLESPNDAFLASVQWMERILYKDSRFNPEMDPRTITVKEAQSVFVVLGKTYDVNTLRTIHSLLSSIFNEAVQHELLAENVWKSVKLPTRL